MRFDVTAMVGVLAAMWLASLGCGLALERALRVRLRNALLLPLGFCASIVLVFPGYVAGAGDALALALLGVVAVAGLVFADGGPWSRLNPGWAGAAGLAAYGLYMLPVLASGHWTWSGYDFVNDSAFEMLLAEHARGFGTALGSLRESSEREFLSSYLSNGYPLGTQTLLGTYAAMLSVPAAVAYQGLISVFGALTAISLASIGERLMRARTAAFVAFFAAGANLTYQYALQGSLKELGLLAALAAVAAIAESAVRLERPYAAAALVAVAVAAALDIYSAVAVAFLGALLLSLGIGLLVTRRTRPSRRWVRAAAVGAVLAAVLAVPVLTTFSTFFHVAQTGQGSSGLGSIQFGQLLRALPLSQISGVWLAGEYRLPVVPQPAATLTVIATVAILVLAVPGALIALRRRSLGPLMLLGGVGLVLAIVYPRVSPYAQGKLLAIGGPLVLFAALLALAMPRGRIAMLGTLLGCGLAVAVLASDLLAYGRDRIAPTSRMEAIQQVGDRFRGQGLVLWNEFEEYAKYFARAALISSPFEAITPQQVQLRHPVYFYGHYFDLDEELLSFVESDPLIVTRRSPAASRPPANFSLVYSNRYYLVWRRLARPRVLGHLPEQTLYSPAAPVDCRALARMARGAPPGSELVAATPPEMTFFEPLYSRDRSLPWGIDPAQPGAVIPNGPGHASGTLVVHARGEYAVWAQGDFPRPVQIRLDGRTLGSAAGSDTPLQWTHVADVVLGPGRHDLSVNRAAGHRHFGPGEWNIGTIGPIALQRRSAETLTTLPPGRWRSLCRTRRDWVELVRP